MFSRVREDCYILSYVMWVPYDKLSFNCQGNRRMPGRSCDFSLVKEGEMRLAASLQPCSGLVQCGTRSTSPVKPLVSLSLFTQKGQAKFWESSGRVLAHGRTASFTGPRGGAGALGRDRKGEGKEEYPFPLLDHPSRRLKYRSSCRRFIVLKLNGSQLCNY